MRTGLGNRWSRSRIGRCLALAAMVAACTSTAALANSVLLCGYSSCELFILGPSTPSPRSSPHMSFRMHPSHAKDGATFHATAGGFLRHEYITIWDYAGTHWNHASQIPGGFASARGTLSFDRETIANVT